MIHIVPVGEVDHARLQTMAAPLSDLFNQPARVDTGIKIPPESLNRRRSQYRADMLLAFLPYPPSGEKTLGVCEVDLYAESLNFIFGQAEIGGRRAVISLLRLRAEYYSLRPDDTLFQERMLKEAVHELGHTYGLSHCVNPICVMHFSSSLANTDIKSWHFCSECRRRLKEKHITAAPRHSG